MNASRRPADTRFNRASPLRLAELAKLPPAALKRYRVEIDFSADGESDTFTWTGTVAGESEAYEAAFDALTADYGAPDDIADTRVALA